MKTTWFVIALCVSTALEMHAQVAANLTSNAFGWQISSNLARFIESRPKPTQTVDPIAAAMRAQQTNQSSQASIQAAARASMAATQQRMPLRGEIELLPEGAIARFGPHHVIFAGNAKTPGAITLWTPNGERLRSTVFGLAYFSPDRKQSVLIAELRSTEGELLPDNRVLYRNAFEGDVEADVLYTYTSHSLEQDVVIRKRVPPPEQYNLPPESHLAVMTEFRECPLPRRTSRVVDLTEHSQRLGVTGEQAMKDEILVFGTMRIVAGKAFVLGQVGLDVPVVKSWEKFDGRDSWFLVESTPYPLLKAQLDSLPHASVQRKSQRQMADVQSAVRRLDNQTSMNVSTNAIRLAKANINGTPGVVLDYLIVNNASLNVDFGGTNKTGFAAIGQTTNDYWNWYVYPGSTSAGLTNLLWSDQSTSEVGVVVANAPGHEGQMFAVDPMYASFIYPSNAGHITVTITNLPSDVYDFYVYAARASDYSPVTEFKRAGTSLWIKGTTIWGNGWYSTYWDEGEQYMRFRQIAVTNQAIVLDAYPDAAGYASLSGLQIIPSIAIPSEQPGISNLLNINFGGYDTGKVGLAAVGLTTNDFWNGYYHPGEYAASVENLKWSDGTTNFSGLTIVNAPYLSTNSLADAMLRSSIYGWGNSTISLTNLPSGNCDFYVYGHGDTPDDNAGFELWSDNVNWGIKGTSLVGYGPTSNAWEVGQQYVLFKDVAVSSNQPVLIHAKHNTYGSNNASGLQIVYKGALDTDADGLPDGWEQRFFNSLSQTATNDFDGDGLSNLREYQIDIDPTRTDSNANGISDLLDREVAWVEDATPQGGYEGSAGDSWNWLDYWHNASGWGGNEVYPYSGEYMHMSALVTNDSHQHYFQNAVAVMRPNTGDVLYAYINLDSSHPPAEVMLQWFVTDENGDGSWEHRAYWGENLIDLGSEATRHYMGPMPTAGDWVRLEVPASLVGLERKVIEGMAFTLYGGRAAWDRAGNLTPDMDGDGLSDSWEIQYFGNLNQTSSGDYDGDGLSNLLEYQGGTNPTDYYNGIVPGLTIVVGNNQSGMPNTFLLSPLVVGLTGTNGVVLTNAPITFAVTQGGAQVATAIDGTTATSIEVRTTTNGQALAYLLLPSSLNTTNYISATAWSGTNSAQVTFTATTLKGVKLWLRADAGITNSSVNRWSDQSGNANDATQSTVTNRPLLVTNVLNGRPVVRFCQTNYLSLPNLLNGATQAEVFVVLKAAADVPSAARGLWRFGSWGTTYANWYPITDGGIREDFGSNIGRDIGDPAQPLDAYHLHNVSGKAGEWIVRLNGVVQCAVQGNTFGYSTAPMLGYSGGYFFDGDVAELLIYNRVLAAAERTAVEVYLNGRYGLVGAVPATPTNLAATAVSPTQVSLQWTEVLEQGATRISVERKTGAGGTYATVAEVKHGGSYLDTGLSAGTTYYYRVRAANLTTWTDYSNEANARTPDEGTAMPLTNLKLWLRADAGLTQISNSTTITYWADQSGNTNHAYQTTSTNRPFWVDGQLNGRPVVRFCQTNYLKLPNLLNGATQAEVFVVLKAAADVPSAARGLWRFGSWGTTYANWYPITDGGIREDFGSNIGRDIGAPPEPVSQYHIYDVTSGGGKFVVRFDGMQHYITTGNTFGYSTAPMLGYSGGYFFDGDVAELLIYNRVLTQQERLSTERYLYSRFNTPYPAELNDPVDSDGDGLSDFAEIAMGTNPLLADTDGDGVSDYYDAFPLDPSLWAVPSPNPSDTTPPVITLDEPANATPLP